MRLKAGCWYGFHQERAARMTVVRRGLGARPGEMVAPLARAPLFLLTFFHHAGPVLLDLVVSPGVLGHFPSLRIAVAQRLFPRAAHAAFVASLREARRGEHGNRKPQRKDCGRWFVHTNHASISLQTSPRAWVTQRRGKSSAACSALLQGCVSHLVGTVTKSSSPRRACENSTVPGSFIAARAGDPLARPRLMRCLDQRSEIRG